MTGSVEVTAGLLAHHPLPDHGPSSSKAERGTVLVVGGSPETPGSVLLAGEACLRAGAGTLQIATTGDVARPLAIAVPEARVVGLPADDSGRFDDAAAERVRSLAVDADTILVGTGTLEPSAVEPLLSAVLDAAAEGGASLVVDAAALLVVGAATIEPVAKRTVLMPNPMELARMLDLDLDDVLDDLERAVHQATGRFGCTVALRGAATWIAGPDHPTYVDTSGNAGLAVSGSGDVLAGLLAGYAARGADLVDAVLWATHVHGLAGERCAAAMGPVGFLAREVVHAVPTTMASLVSRR